MLAFNHREYYEQSKVVICLMSRRALLARKLQMISFVANGRNTSYVATGIVSDWRNRPGRRPDRRNTSYVATGIVRFDKLVDIHVNECRNTSYVATGIVSLVAG